MRRTDKQQPGEAATSLELKTAQRMRMDMSLFCVNRYLLCGFIGQRTNQCYMKNNVIINVKPMLIIMISLNSPISCTTE